MKLYGYQQLTYFCVRMEFVVGTTSLHAAVCVHVRSAQLRSGNGVLFCMCSAVEVAWYHGYHRITDIAVQVCGCV